LFAIAAVALVALAGIAPANNYWKVNTVTNSTSGRGLWDAAAWRTRLYLRKATGALPELTWGQLWELTSEPGGFALESVIKEGRSVGGAMTNPYVRASDLESGGRIFRARCAMCHGADGTGWRAPSLNRPGLKHGDSDFAVYKILTDGIPGTAMTSTGLSLAERGQVIAFMRTLQLRSAVEEEAPSRTPIAVSGEKIEKSRAGSKDWLAYSGSQAGWRYSSLAEITTANVAKLRTLWIHQFDTSEQKFEATPLAVGGTIFTTAPPATVYAFNGQTGEVVWRYERKLPADLRICCGSVNRGLAILDSSVFFGSLDGYLVSIDANTGSVNWQVQIAPWSAGYTITGAPLIANNLVIVGVSGGEFGIRGFLAAFDAKTGKERWRFNTIPGPGEKGHETWESDGWRTGGGATWVTGSYDPALDLIYWGVGNPSPPFDGSKRPGDNLYTNSVIALNASSGKLAWHFQFTPHDEHDWDSNQTPVLANLTINSVERKAICWPNRNGFYYVLDRTTGEFLVGVPFVEQNWAQGVDSAGRPVRVEGSVTNTGRLTRPGVWGGTNWQPIAFDPDKALVFVHATEGASVFTKSGAQRQVRGENGEVLGSGSIPAGPLVTVVRALDASSGARRWEYRSPTPKMGDYGGLLATAGGLVLGASGGVLFALDSGNGKELWRVALGGATLISPVSFALDGHQVIVISAGKALIVLGL